MKENIYKILQYITNWAKELTRLGLDGTNSCPGASGVNPKKRKFLMAIFVSRGLVEFLSRQMMTCSQCSTSSAYSSRETKASLLPLHSCSVETPGKEKEDRMFEISGAISSCNERKKTIG